MSKSKSYFENIKLALCIIGVIHMALINDVSPLIAIFYIIGFLSLNTYIGLKYEEISIKYTVKKKSSKIAFNIVLGLNILLLIFSLIGFLFFVFENNTKFNYF